MSIKKRIEIDTDNFLIELLMVVVDRLGGDITVNEDDLERVVDGENELAMNFSKNSDSLRLRVKAP